MLGGSFPPSPFGILACFGLIPLLVVLESLERHSLRYIFLSMFVFHLITLNWTGGYAHMNDPYMMIAGGVTMTLHPFFYFIPLGVFVIVKKRFGTIAALGVLPFLWVAYEYSHTLSEWSFPWITLGNSQSYDIARIQFIEYTGVLGLSFWIVVLNVLGFLLYRSLRINGISFRSPLNATLFASILLLYILPTLHGRIVLSTPKHESTVAHNPQSSASIRVGIVQSNVDPWEKWKNTGFESVELYLRMTDSLVKLNMGQHPDLVLWPETAMPHHVLLQQNKASLAMIRERVDSLGLSVLFGLPHAVFYDDQTEAPPSAKRIQTTGERYDAFNAAAFVQPHIEQIPWYGKMKMVPIAERVPYADAFYFFDFLRWGVGIGGWQIGRDTVIFQENRTGAKFCGLICYESVYPEFVASFVKKGAEFIAILTIDSWWSYMSGAYQHHQYAIFRAIENRRWIARCAVGGFSSYIDPMGNVHDKTELFTQAVLCKTLERRTALTFFSVHGEWLGKLCSAFSVLIVLVAFVKRKPQT
jgi:apolipoprotein N-acyltransferase